MSERLTDEQLTGMDMWDRDVMLDERHRAVGAMLVRMAVAEIREHRARIATHATAHPERLSEEDIERWIAQVGGADRSGLRASPRETGRDRAIYLAMLEIQQRRAADLTEPQIDQVRAMLRDDVADRPIVCGPERIEILSDIIRSHGARP